MQINGGQLPLTVEEPKFLADPSHRKRVFAKSIYNLANASKKVSSVTKGLAGHLKYCYGACVKRYRHLEAEQLAAKVNNILEHICDIHEQCEHSWCYNKKAEVENKTYSAPTDHRVNKFEDAAAYDQLRKIFNQYASITQMGYCNHPFDTQTNEALNQESCCWRILSDNERKEFVSVEVRIRSRAAGGLCQIMKGKIFLVLAATLRRHHNFT
jgi:hypothetical protein